MPNNPDFRGISRHIVEFIHDYMQGFARNQHVAELEKRIADLEKVTKDRLATKHDAPPVVNVNADKKPESK